MKKHYAHPDLVYHPIFENEIILTSLGDGDNDRDDLDEWRGM